MPGAGRRTFRITEQRRTGAGTLVDTPVQFEWDARTHTKPVRGIRTPLAIRTVRKEYAGTTQPVEQALHASWQPFDFEGSWDDKWAGPGFAERMRREFAQFVSRAPLVRIEWDDVDLVGIITEYVPTHLDATKTRYKITFSPHSDPSGGDLPIFPPTPQATQGYIDQVDAIATTAEELQADARDLQMADESYAEAQEELDSWRAQVDELQGTSGIFGLDETASVTLRRQAGRFRSLRASAQRILVKTAVMRAQTVNAYDDTIQELRFDQWSRDLAATAALMIASSRDAEIAFEARAESTPIRTYRPFRDQNIYSVSLDVYGTTEAWRAIYLANNLDTLTFDGTEILIIPEDATLNQ